jgi:hypothetical protein
MREGALRDDVPPAIYIPVTQRSTDALYVVVRGTLPSSMLTTLVRETDRSMDPNLPIAEVRTSTTSWQTVWRRSASRRRCWGRLPPGVAAGRRWAVQVISYSVAQRTQELGVRAALGARPSDLMRLVFRQGTGVLVAGLAAARSRRSVFRAHRQSAGGIGPRDPATFAVAGPCSRSWRSRQPLSPPYERLEATPPGVARGIGALVGVTAPDPCFGMCS